jgi:hypothetical protein
MYLLVVFLRAKSEQSVHARVKWERSITFNPAPAVVWSGSDERLNRFEGRMLEKIFRQHAVVVKGLSLGLECP